MGTLQTGPLSYRYKSNHILRKNRQLFKTIPVKEYGFAGPDIHSGLRERESALSIYKQNNG